MIAVPEWLRQRAYLSPDRLALVFQQERWTYRELDQRVTQAANRLHTLGIGAESRVGVLMNNSADFVVLVHAISRVGAVLILLNRRLSPAEIEWQITDSAPQIVICDDPEHVKSGMSVEQFNALPETPATYPEQIDLENVRCILYTSGTTGKPKGAMLTHGNFWWSAIGSALNLGTLDSDVWLVCLPLFHVGGLSILFRAVIYGVPVILHEKFDPAAVNQAIIYEQVTIISVVSNTLQRMLDVQPIQPIQPIQPVQPVQPNYPATLRCVLLGGGPAPKPLLEDCARRNIPVLQTYGLTETASQVVTLSPADALRKLGSAGKPLFPNEVRIENREGPGEIGEIIVRGPTVFAGYLNPMSATEETPIRDGWLHTGDLGYLDAEGYLYIVDRRSDLIISGGENVYPAEIEAVLLAHTSIAEAGVIGISDARWGQVAVAIVRVRDGAQVTADALRVFCTGHLARYKVPAEIRFTTSPLPRSAAGKLLRRELAEAWTEE